MRCLFQSINSLLEVANMIRTSWIDEPWRLCHVNSLNKITMKKGILDIQLTEGPATRNGKTEDGTNRSGPDNRTESFIKINTSLLMKTLCYKPGFVALNRTICPMLKFKDPFAADDILLRRRRNQYPSVVLQEGIKFGGHSLLPCHSGTRAA